MTRDERRRREQSWKAKGYTQLPNILLSKALPVGVRATAAAIYARGFGQRQGVCLATETLARDVGVSRQTIAKHLNILELAGVIKRVRRGRGLANIIILSLKNCASNLADSIAKALPSLRNVVIQDTKRTTAWWMDRWRTYKGASVVLRNAYSAQSAA